MKFLLFFLFLFFLQGVTSQENNSVRFGLKAGSNFSHINFSKGSPPPETPILTNWQPGIVAGFLVVIPLIDQLYFQPEYLFHQMGGKIEDENRQYSINYLSLPVLIQWQFLNRFSFLAGPQFDLLINARDKTGNNTVSIEKDIEHRSIAFTAGLQYTFTDNMIVGIRYMHGFNHIGIVRDTGYEEFKYESMQFSFSYLFYL